MKKILLPALAGLMLAGTSAAFAAGPWYVVFNKSTHYCSAEHRLAQGPEETTVSGPLASHVAAVSAADQLGMCGGTSGAIYGAGY